MFYSLLGRSDSSRITPPIPHTLNRQRLASVRETMEGWPSLEELERKYIQQVLQRFGGKKGQAARVLGIASNTLWRKLKGSEG